ncbi:hypothetical protein SARC_01030 [Sphaeroforma arctica JP610]|uniref:Uncharacterized protein n=1 Tax=Sphaeroforma arctica JP610 TaxID=667725 RepID=A0A0L0GCU2_9EUKA|nr:hypothetical protein SARC_01030 [Sphaeroforma arctica JP610]KNC86837.1 hypothetical protein SARC_01030 [Sphaeroforma arctica JP610]|eukprot:XP_014160739.1 hypothetical protein SARC_01030 [Sphaeroforma arctica JP610]
MEANTVTQVQEKDLSPDLNVINNDVEDIKRLIANAKIDEPLPTDDHILEKPKQIVEPEIKFPLLKIWK